VRADERNRHVQAGGGESVRVGEGQRDGERVCVHVSKGERVSVWGGKHKGRERGREGRREGGSEGGQKDMRWLRLVGSLTL